MEVPFNTTMNMQTNLCKDSWVQSLVVQGCTFDPDTHLYRKGDLVCCEGGEVHIVLHNNKSGLKINVAIINVIIRTFLYLFPSCSTFAFLLTNMKTKGKYIAVCSFP